MADNGYVYPPCYSLHSLMREGHRSNNLWGKYNEPFVFNIIVNDMAEIQAYETVTVAQICEKEKIRL